MLPLKLYRSISELPLCRFIDCAVDNNLYALVISGKPDENELAALWEKIKVEYADAMKDNEHKLFSSLTNEINRLEITYQQIQIVIGVLKDRYVEAFGKMLNEWLRTSFKFDVQFPGDYDNDLKRANNRSKGIKLDLDLKRLRWEKLKGRYQDGDKASRENFQTILITLSDRAGFTIQDSIMTFEFCERIRRLNKYLESLNNHPGARRSR